MSKTLKEKTAHGIVWSFIDKFGQQGINFIVFIILTRFFLSPEHYALYGMIVIVNALGGILVDSGFSNALIRKQNPSQTDFSSVFYFNIAISLLFYLIAFLAAPLFALYFHQPILTNLIRIMALCIPINSLSLVQNVLLLKKINLKYIATTNLISYLCSGSLSIFLAWKGLGVWVLIIQLLTYYTMRAVCFWCFNNWRPSITYSKESIKNLWGYSSKLLLSSTISVIFTHIYAFFIGRIYPLKQMGFYTQANKYAELPNNTILSAIQAVVYPTMANIGENDSEALKKVMRKTIRVASFVILPVMLGLIAVAEPLIQTLIGARWLPLVPYLQILSVGYIFLGLTTFYNNILFVKGLSSTFLYFNILYRALIVISIVITMYQGITAMIIAWNIVAIIYATFMMFYVGRKIHYTFVEQIKDIMPYFILAFIMGAGVFSFTLFIHNSLILLLVQLIVGVSFYLGATYLLGSKVFREAIEVVKKRV